MFVELTEAERSDQCTRELSFIHEGTGLLSSGQMLKSLGFMRSGVTSARALFHYEASERALHRLHEAGEAHGWLPKA